MPKTIDIHKTINWLAERQTASADLKSQNTLSMPHQWAYATAKVNYVFTNEGEAGFPVSYDAVDEETLPYGIGVHVGHCCAKHGCKYITEDFCPVAEGVFAQEHPCEFCDWDKEEEVPGIEAAIKILEDLAKELTEQYRNVDHSLWGSSSRSGRILGQKDGVMLAIKTLKERS